MTFEIIIDVIGIVTELLLIGALLVLARTIFVLGEEIQALAFYVGRAFGISDEPEEELSN